ncbi:dTMP kinase [Paenibacillus filicis]|uniref:Thymidylate kinase n=1 Tax=Paenibacillus gyeongsangnamensis TaxID=3388067 RepID=A0ABT4QKX0_9BACL|nr:dTMP kinase [Paenibacillus filicis]MCZ8517524.1 dTMP kinase [Paenibacillus filicis]
MKSGFFITVEGGEGAGKSSAIQTMIEVAAQRGFEIISTREPGGIPIAEQIRGIVLDRANTAMDARTEALLYAAARRQHLAEKVIPALEAGKVVICDRFIDSSLAYQGHARGLGINEVFSINRFAVGDWMPQLTIFMDVLPEVGLARIEADLSREVNRLDLESLVFHRKVREGYLLVAERFPDRIVRIDAGQELEAVLQKITEVLNQKLPGRV